MTLLRSAFLLLLSLAVVQPLAAQTPAPFAVPENQAPLAETLKGDAKAEYDAARILFGAGDFAGALVKFEQALEHSRDLRLLWNMAVCEKNLRHYVRVRRLLERYRRDGGDRLTATQKSDVASVLHTVETLVSEVQLSVEPDGAEVFLDDVSEGVTPLAEPLLVDLGTRKIRISKPGFEDWQLTREFVGHSFLTMNATLRPEPRDGSLTIFADPNSTITIDGAVAGSNGHLQQVMTAGEHRIQITAVDRVAFVRDITLKVGESRTLHVTLNAQSSGISPWIWVGVGVVAAGAIGTAVYFLTRPAPDSKPVLGTLPPLVKIN
jgi:PEGA domain